MEHLPCRERRFAQNISALVVRVEATYAFWLKHLVERLGASAARELWAGAFDAYDHGFLDQILSSGWSAVEPAASDGSPSMMASVLGSHLGSSGEGMESSEAERMIGATPPLPQIRERFSDLDVERSTTAYEALHLYIHGLALLSEALIDCFGKQGELVAYDVLTSGRASMGRRIGGSVADYMREFNEELDTPGIYWAGLDVEIVSSSSTEHVSRVTHCEWARYFRERHPRVGYLVACSADEAFGRGYNECLRMQRTSTLMEGGSECDFRWYSVGEAEEDSQDSGAT